MNLMYMNLLPDILDQKVQETSFFLQSELIYILRGEMKLTIYERSFLMQPEDIVVINACERCGFHASEDILFARLRLPDNRLAGENENVDYRFICNSVLGDKRNYDELRHVLKNLLTSDLHVREHENRVSYLYLSCYYELMQILTVHFMTGVPEAVLSKHEKNEQRMYKITSYIEKNYHQEIRFDALARYMYLSEGYLSRYFKENFHMKFSDYVKKVRLKHAAEALLYTDRPVTKIAYDCGFSGISVFNRVFKDVYGETPSAFRRRTARKGVQDGTNAKGEGADIKGGYDQQMTHRLAEYLRENAMQKHSREQAICEHCVFRADQSEPLKPVWNRMINIGSAADCLKSEIQEHIILLKQALDYDYVRFWSIFSEDMLIDVYGDESSYNFSKLDLLLDFLTEQGLKPFFDMEEKTRRINKNIYTSIVYTETPLVFRSIGQFQRLMDALIRHLVKRYGVRAMSEWKMEVWFGGYTIEGMEPYDSYFHIFRNVFAIVKKYVPQMAVGGCGVFPEAIKDAWLRSRNIWEEWHGQAPRPDFISVMNYAYEADSDGRDFFGYRSSDPQYLLHAIQQLKRELKKADFDGIPVYVTEWNLTISDRNYMNDSCFQGAYIIKNVIDVCKETEILGYFMGSDRISQYYDSGQLLYGAPGLLSKDSILKPAAFAIDFLNHLQEYLVKWDRHFLVTTDQEGSYHIVCHNMKALGPYYYMVDEGQLDREHVDDCFEDLESLHLDIGMDGVHSGSYVVRVYRVNHNSGSILNVWEEIGFHQELMREDIKYIRRICEPRLSIWNMEVKDHRLELSLELKPNEIALVRLTRG